MAVTRTDFVVPSGFTSETLLDKLGEVLAHIGLLSTPTDWLDSFDDQHGYYRVFSQTVGTGTRNSVIHMFFTPDNGTGLWYTSYTQWDATTHRALGSSYRDMARTYNWPGEISSSWSSYYNWVCTSSNASDFTFTTLENNTNGKTAAVWAHNTSESRCMLFITGDPTLDPDAPDLEDVHPPLGLMGFNTSSTNVGFVSANNLKSNILTAYHDGGDSSSDYTASTSQTSFRAGGAAESIYYMGATASCSSQNHFYRGPGTSYQENVENPSYRGGFEAQLCYPIFTDVHSGDIGHIAARDSSFNPQVGDTLVVTAGVEEYLVMLVQTSVVVGAYGNNWICAVARTV